MTMDDDVMRVGVASRLYQCASGNNDAPGRGAHRRAVATCSTRDGDDIPEAAVVLLAARLFVGDDVVLRSPIWVGGD